MQDQGHCILCQSSYCKILKHVKCRSMEKSAHPWIANLFYKHWSSEMCFKMSIQFHMYNELWKIMNHSAYSEVKRGTFSNIFKPNFLTICKCYTLNILFSCALANLFSIFQNWYMKHILTPQMGTSRASCEKLRDHPLNHKQLQPKIMNLDLKLWTVWYLCPLLKGSILQTLFLK